MVDWVLTKPLWHCPIIHLSAIEQHSELVVQMCFLKKAFLEILQNSQKNTCARSSFLIKMQVLGLQLY